MARFCGAVDPEEGDFPRSTVAYCTDAFCISIGALLGVSPVTAYIESGAGIVEGGRTGLTGIVAGLCFIVSMFFAPIFASIPPWATGCTLVIVSLHARFDLHALTNPQVGCLMMRQVASINWRYIGDAIPAFVTLMFIPFSYSAAYGLIAGLLIYAALNLMAYLTQLITCGYLVPDDADAREYWSRKFLILFCGSFDTDNITQSDQVVVTLGLSGLGKKLRTDSKVITRTIALQSRAALLLPGVTKELAPRVQIER